MSAFPRREGDIDPVSPAQPRAVPVPWTRGEQNCPASAEWTATLGVTPGGPLAQGCLTAVLLRGPALS